MTTIYHVDPQAGNNSHDGLSWATAWASTLPLATLYATASAVTDIEVRFAKTAPLAVGLALPTAYVMTATGNNTKRKVIGTETSSAVNTVSTRGGALQTGFIDGTTAGTERPSGVGHSRFQGATPTSTGRAVKWTLSSAQDYSMFHCIEFVAAVFAISGRDMTALPVYGTLEMCSDSAGENIVWSRDFKFGPGKDRANFVRLGSGDLPSGILSIWLRVHFVPDLIETTLVYSYSSMYAVHNPYTADYVGFMRVHHCTTGDGCALQPSRFEAAQETTATTETVAYNVARTQRGLPSRLYDTYPVTPLTHDVAPIFPAATTVGLEATPVRFIGGWNKETNTVDGLSCIDAGNLLHSPSAPMHWHVRFANLVLGFLRGQVQVSYASTAIAPRSVCTLTTGVSTTASVYADNVHIPPGTPGNMSIVARKDEDAARNDALMRVSLVAPNALAGAVTGCSTGFGCIVSTNYVDSAFRYKGCYFMYLMPLVQHPNYPMEDCTIGLIEVGVSLGSRANMSAALRCRFIGSNREIYTQLGLGVPYLECEVWGGGVMGNATGRIVSVQDSVIYPFTTAYSSSLCVGANFTNVRFDLGSDPNTSAYNATQTMANGTGSENRISMVNSSVAGIYSRLSLAGAAYHLENVTLQHVVGSASTAIAQPNTLTVRNLTLDGPWATMLTGTPVSADVRGVVFTNANTKLHNPYAYPTQGVWWGRVSCAFVDLFHPLGFDGVLGAPSSAVSSTSYLAAGGATYTMRGGEPVWVAAHMTVRKDTTVKATGAFSWRFTATMNIGSKFVGSIMLGFYEMTQGRTITVTCKMRRSHDLCHGCLFVQPLDTKPYTYDTTQMLNMEREVVADQDYTQPLGGWDTVTLQYTAERTGMMELYFGMRAISGSSVWLDDIKVS